MVRFNLFWDVKFAGAASINKLPFIQDVQAISFLGKNTRVTQDGGHNRILS